MPGFEPRSPVKAEYSNQLAYACMHHFKRVILKSKDKYQDMSNGKRIACCVAFSLHHLVQVEVFRQTLDLSECLAPTLIGWEVKSELAYIYS
jgi:hypothetical protein